MTFYHTQENRNEQLQEPIICTNDNAWLGEALYFWEEENDLIFKIIMDISLHSEEFFDLNLVAVGTFELDKELDENDLKKKFVNTNAPAIMFPCVRAFITTLTSNLGNVTGTLTVPTQFFQGDLPEISTDKEETKQHRIK